VKEYGVYGKIFMILIKSVTTAEADDAKLSGMKYALMYEWARSTAALLEELYPSDIFTGNSGDPGVMAILEIKKQLNAFLKGEVYV
jgi:hypothetical protein